MIKLTEKVIAFNYQNFTAFSEILFIKHNLII